MDAIGSNSSIQLRLAQAYGVSPQKRGAAGAVGRVPQAAASLVAVAASGQRSGSEPAEASRVASPGPSMSPGARSLIGATVGGGIDFVVGDDHGAAHSPRQVLAMYRNPADRNAAATGVAAGRRLDVVG